ncbi:ABC transporter ATP-binding protein [Rhodococcus sp. NPDC057529]|uniref:ABC transporter ATP-binding protein n=1 Tax=Rhodococcus sp. NPDC057529 TaxID=3346158 RepID=UPI003671A786
MTTSTTVASQAEDTDAPALDLRGIDRRFDTARGVFTALRGVDITAQRGEFVSVVGPSGCGKSTLLALIAGLAKPQSGSVSVLGQQVSGVRKDVGLIFQKDALLPWRTALQNVMLPLRFRGVPRKEAEERATAWLERVGLGAFASSYPHQLSGGMRKRVAIAATLVYEPAVLLLDEPFSALDVQSRNLMENDLLDLWSVNRPTVLFITHDLEEAVGLSDRVLVMSAGPGKVIGDYAIPLERPRDLLEIRFDPAFVDLHHEIWEQLRGEVQRSRAAMPAPA